MRSLVLVVASLVWVCSFGGCHQSLSWPDGAIAGVDGGATADVGPDVGVALDGGATADAGPDVGGALDGGAPGYLGGPCVPHTGADTGGQYNYCYDSAATCDGNVCVPCGQVGQTCCTQPNNGIDWSCAAGLACDRPADNILGTCSDTCGAAGAPCCNSGFCQRAPVFLNCTSDVSGTCEGAPCCAGSRCPAGFACSLGICIAAPPAEPGAGLLRRLRR